MIPSVWSKNEIEPNPFALFSSFSNDPIECGNSYVNWFGSPPFERNLAFADLSYVPWEETLLPSTAIIDFEFSNASLKTSSWPLIFCSWATSVGIKL